MLDAQHPDRETPYSDSFREADRGVDPVVLENMGMPLHPDEGLADLEKRTQRNRGMVAVAAARQTLRETADAQDPRFQGVDMDLSRPLPPNSQKSNR